MQIQKVEFIWNEDAGISECFIREGKEIYWGTAVCHREDSYFKSSRIGSTISYLRACITMNKEKLRDKEAEFKALKHLKNSYEQSYRYNKDSFEAKCLNKEYNTTYKQIEKLKEEIRTDKKELDDYLKNRKKYQDEVNKKK